MLDFAKFPWKLILHYRFDVARESLVICPSWSVFVTLLLWSCCYILGCLHFTFKLMAWTIWNNFCLKKKLILFRFIETISWGFTCWVWFSAIARTVGHLSKSAEVMKLVNNLMKAPEMAATMQEFSREMTKVCFIISWIVSMKNQLVSHSV